MDLFPCIFKEFEKAKKSQLFQFFTNKSNLENCILHQVENLSPTSRYVQLKGGMDLVEKLAANETLMSNKSAKQGVEDMKLLLNYCNLFNVMDKVSFDLSLARGLDYYTGTEDSISDQRGGGFLYFYIML